MLATGIVTLAGMSFAGHAAAAGRPAAGRGRPGASAGRRGLDRHAGRPLPARACGHAPRCGEALRRHSRLALVAAPVVVLTGLANSPLLLGDTRELVASGYGDPLLSKALLFCVAVGIGSVNYFLVRLGRVRRSLPLIGGGAGGWRAGRAGGRGAGQRAAIGQSASRRWPCRRWHRSTSTARPANRPCTVAVTCRRRATSATRSAWPT